MATNYTEHYQLNQWEPEDKVLRTDFNADNLKIDGAIKAVRDEVAAEAAAREAADTALGGRIDAVSQRAGLQQLGSLTLSQAAQTVTLDLSSIDWSQWATIRVVFKPVAPSGGLKYYIQTTGSSSRRFGNLHYSNFQLHLYPTFDVDVGLTGFYWPLAQDSGRIDCVSIQGITGIVFSADTGTFQPGSKAMLWGSK